MRGKICVCALSIVVSMLVFSTVFGSTIGSATTIPDSSSSFTHTTGLPTSTIGRGGSSHQSVLYIPNATSLYTGKWSSFGATTSYTQYKWYVYIPYNEGAFDAMVNYYVSNDSETFSVTVNQENYGDVWVFLGWAAGNGTPSLSYTSMNNKCVPGGGCETYYQVWWDDARYYPCIDPIYTGDCTGG
ncbi:MAG: hypothetical protein WA116_10165 [Anaerolineaceae bacterium]